MGRGTLDVYTCWTPLGDVTPEMGPLVLCLGSHRWGRVRETYGRCDVDRDLIEGIFSRDPAELVDRLGGRWATAAVFGPGDVVIFGLYMLHASLVNTTGRYRLSCDTRYQRAGEPMDDRWAGAAPAGPLGLLAARRLAGAGGGVAPAVGNLRADGRPRRPGTQSFRPTGARRTHADSTPAGQRRGAGHRDR